MGYIKYITYEFECSTCQCVEDVVADNLKEALHSLRHKYEWIAGKEYTCPTCALDK